MVAAAHKVRMENLCKLVCHKWTMTMCWRAKSWNAALAVAALSSQVGLAGQPLTPLDNPHVAVLEVDFACKAVSVQPNFCDAICTHDGLREL